MTERRKQYPFNEFEPKWQRHWDEHRTFAIPNPGDPGFDASRPKFYVLDMFPYPSGEGLHVGHAEGYTATDILARYKRMRGFNVLHPMGWDAFGLPAEQFAIKTGQHPSLATVQNLKRFKAQLQKIGLSYDWGREINTTDPGYYRWTQWIFLQLYDSWFDPEQKKARPIAELNDLRARSHPDDTADERRAFLDQHRLAYVTEAPVNWCPELGTVLANEEVVDGRSEVGGFPVVRRPMRQWMLRITAYADRLVEELDTLAWPESIKTLQRNWIGRSQGAEVRFPVQGSLAEVPVFTTRPDTLFGATYLVLAPEHPLVANVTTDAQRAAVERYLTEVATKSDLERTDLARTKTGVFTGAHAINPVNRQPVPIWIADYVLVSYGTGAIMAVPAHDERDFEFARKFGLEIREVVAAPKPVEGCFTGEGTAINSAFLNGLSTEEAKRRIITFLEEQGSGRSAISYKLRDWLFSRQRYWGEPFPIVWRNGHHEALPETDLPVVPPPLEDYRPTGTIEPPLAKAGDWIRLSDGTTRELNTMPQWAGSCWYYLRYLSPGDSQRFVDAAAERYWMGGEGGSSSGVDLYVGGTEHAVLHLLYARFWHKVLYDLGHVSTREPFRQLVNQGMILGFDNHKMSKSRGNVVNPDDVIADYGADSLRLYEMFLGPLEATKPWSTSGVEGVYRFLARVWRLAMEETQEGQWQLSAAVARRELSSGERKVIHATIKKVTEDLEALAFNTAIAQLMICVNEFTGAPVKPVEALRTLLVLLNPLAPHLSEELWARLAHAFPTDFTGLASAQPWPRYNPEYLTEDEVEVVLQINGKLRDKVLVRRGLSREALESQALAMPKVQAYTAGKTVRKVVVVPDKLVNVVVG